MNMNYWDQMDRRSGHQRQAEEPIKLDCGLCGRPVKEGIDGELVHMGNCTGPEPGLAGADRFLMVHSTDRPLVEALLPKNYEVLKELGTGELLVVGKDNAGWTLEDYVIPRLGSAMIFSEEYLTPV